MQRLPAIFLGAALACLSPVACSMQFSAAMMWGLPDFLRPHAWALSVTLFVKHFSLQIKLYAASSLALPLCLGWEQRLL